MARFVTPLLTTYEWDQHEDGLPILRSVTRLEWEATGLINFFNIDMFVHQCDVLHSLDIAVPPMPAGVQVRLTTRQFAEVLAHPVAEIREWMVVNVLPRIRLRPSVRRGQ